MKRIKSYFTEKWLNKKQLSPKSARHDAALAPMIVGVGGAAAVPPAGRFDQLAAEGYQQNVIAYRCVNVIARGLGSVPLLLYQKEYGRRRQGAGMQRVVVGEHEVEAHPILDLLNEPSPLQARSTFLEQVISYLLLSGNTYVEAVLNADGVPVGLTPIRPDRVSVVPSPTQRGTRLMPKCYDVKLPGRQNGQTRVRSYPVDPISGQSNILHIKLFHPMNDWYGLSPMEAAARSIDQHNAVGGHNLALLNNGGRPSGALMVKNQENGLGLTQSQRDTLKEDLRAAYEGSANAGRVMLLEGDFEWREMGLTPKDLDFVEGKNLSAREICQAFGVPPMLAGIVGDATFANYREARLHLWEDTILPLLDLLIAELNVWLLPTFGEDYRLGYDLDAIQALAPKREAAWAKIAAADFLTVDERRQAVGYGPLPV